MSAPALSGFKIPKEAADAAKLARDGAAAKKKAMDAAKVANDSLDAAKAAVEGLASGPAAAAALQAKQAALDLLEHPLAGAYPNPKAIAKAREEVAALTQLAANFAGKDALVQGLTQRIADGAVQLTELTQARDLLNAKADSIIPLKMFERNRTKDPLRTTETDLVKMRAALEEFANSPLQPTAQCVQDYRGFVLGLQTAIDDKAHAAVCHKCQTANKVDRTEAAKQAVLAKVDALKTLAARPNDAGLDAVQQADYLLAKSIKKMSDDRDETGKTAGKMIGALICDDGQGGLVTLYGYSGVVWDQQRAVEAEIFRAKALADAAPADAALQAALAAAQVRLPAAVAADAAGNAALALQNAWAPPIPEIGGTMASLGGAVETVDALKLINGGNNKVGGCSAPKMVQAAIAAGYKPIAMAEAWMGGGDNKDGELVASCDTCMSNIGFQLCETCT